MNFFFRFKFHLWMIFANILCAFSYFITGSAFRYGMLPAVYTTYRLAIGGLALLPFAYFLERRNLPVLTWMEMIRITMLSLLGTALPMIAFFEGMKRTSPAIAAAINNTIPAMVFGMAIIMKMEALNVRSWRGAAKLLGALLSLSGVTVIALYKGLTVSEFKWAPIRYERSTGGEDLLKGSALVVVSCVSLAISYVVQTRTLEVYPAKVCLSVWINLIGAVLSAVYTVATTKMKINDWSLGPDPRLWAILYGGLSGSGFLVFIQLWCTKEKGPVFMTMFNPVTTLVSLLVAYFLIGSKLYLGSILGSVVVVLGLYCIIWGKMEDQTPPPAPDTAKHLEEV